MSQAPSIQSAAVRSASDQVELEVHVGPGDACDTVEPEAGDGGEIPLEQHKYIVVVRHILLVVAEEELREGFDLTRTEESPLVNRRRVPCVAAG